MDIFSQMEWDSSDDGLDAFMSSQESESPELTPTTSKFSEHEFSCHCCYDILVNPTTLTCGHNFCRHCLALWWESSHKNECPECREKWEGFPKINILLRCAFHCLMWPHCSHFSNMQKTQYRCRFGHFAMHKTHFALLYLTLVLVLSSQGMQLTNCSAALFNRGEQRSKRTPKSPAVCWPSRGSGL